MEGIQNFAHHHGFAVSLLALVGLVVILLVMFFVLGNACVMIYGFFLGLKQHREARARMLARLKDSEVSEKFNPGVLYGAIESIEILLEDAICVRLQGYGDTKSSLIRKLHEIQIKGLETLPFSGEFFEDLKSFILRAYEVWDARDFSWNWENSRKHLLLKDLLKDVCKLRERLWDEYTIVPY